MKRASVPGKKKWIVLAALALLPLNHVHAQEGGGDEDRSELDSIEAELEKSKSRVSPTEPAYVEDNKPRSAQELSNLGKLAPFSEISVIQRRFLPKTGRFQASLAGSIVTNNAFFNGYGGTARFGYYLSETWGLDLDMTTFSTSARDITKEIDDFGLKTTNLVVVDNVIGANIIFVPIYGKMTFFNNSIVPFDLYFSAGYAATNTPSEKGIPTLHLRTGQVFAITKGFALRWDFNFDMFSATDDAGEKSVNNNLYMTLGASIFFPEANYR